MEEYLWLFESAIGLLALLTIQYTAKRIVRKASESNPKSWKTRIKKAFVSPFLALVWTLGCLYFIRAVEHHTGFFILGSSFAAIQKGVWVVGIAWAFYRWKLQIELAFRETSSKKVDLTTIQIISRIATIVIVIFSLLLLLQIFGMSVAPLLTFGGIGAAAIGFASKDVVANFCSGLILYIFRPFVIGDLILLPEKNLEGFVEDIGWFRTSIRDPDKRAVYLPNNFFSTLFLVNVSRATHKHIKQIIKIKLEGLDKLPQIITEMRAYLENRPEIDIKCPINIFLKSFGDYACEVQIEAYSTIKGYREFLVFQDTLLLKLVDLLKQMGTELAVPVINLQTTTSKSS